MKTIFSPLKFSRGLLVVTLTITLSYSIDLHGQDNGISAKPISTDNIRTYVNAIKEKADQVHAYAEQAYNANTVKDANSIAKQALLVLEDAKNITKNAQTALDVLSTAENKNKCGRYLTSIASDIFDLQNKIEWATHEAGKIVKLNELSEIKHSATEVMTETKKMNDDVAETITTLALTDRELNAIEE
jgi:hypothetical protein